MSGRTTTSAPPPCPLAWPGDAEAVTADAVDFEALAHVLANRCRRGGHMRRYHSLAAHAVLVSEEIEAFDGLGAEERPRLALHALIAGAASAWLGGERSDSARAAERTTKLAAAIERAVREAAGLDAVLDEDHAELLRFVTRMAAAAEVRDLLDGAGAGGLAFPPFKRRIKPLPPERAAALWLERYRALAGSWGSRGGAEGPNAGRS